jgi:glutathione S-transferase
MTLPKPRLLRSAPASPFGRKIKIAAACLGLLDGIEIVTANTLDAADPVRNDNPLGKIPTLILDDGTVLYDSKVILDYLDLLSGGRLLPADPLQRLLSLRGHALADGIAEAALLIVYEGRFRAKDKHDAAWLAHQQGKIERGLAWLEAHPPAAPSSVIPDLAAIGTACALGYLDLRHAGRWRVGHPRLVAWLDAFEAAWPIYAKTRVTS